MSKEEELLSLDPRTGDGIAHLEMRIPRELLRRFIIKALEEDETFDFLDIQSYQSLIARIGNVRKWMNSPLAEFTYMPSSFPSVSTQTQVREEKESLRVALPAPVPTPAPSPKQQKRRSPGKAKKNRVPRTGETKRQRITRLAREVPPHRWMDDCRIPKADASLSDKERNTISHWRNEEKQIIEQLLSKWQSGTFQISEEAEEAEAVYQARQTKALNETIEEVAKIVNGNRIH